MRCPDKENMTSQPQHKTAIRELSLRHNREVYPEQPFDAANVGNNSDIDRENEENVSGEPEEGYGLNGEASADAAELAAYDAGRMSLAERAAPAVAAMSAKNRADVEARREAVKALGGMGVETYADTETGSGCWIWRMGKRG